MSIHGFERLPAWRRSADLVKAIHRFAHRLPADEKALLAAALKKSALSIPTGIAAAHGAGREAMAGAMEQGLATLREIHSHLALAQRLGYVSRYHTHGVRRKMTRLQRCLAKGCERADETGSSAAAKPAKVWPPRLAA